MSDQIELQAALRENTGTSACRNLRRQKRVPAILYGGKKEPQPLSLSLFELQRQMQEDSFYTSILHLKTPDGQERAILKALEHHPVRSEPVHLDFLRVTDSTRVVMPIPLTFINEDKCVGVQMAGGIPTYQLTQATIAARADSIPDRLEVDMEHVGVGEPVLLSSIVLPPGVSIPVLEQGQGQDPVVAIVVPPKISKEDRAADAAEAGETEEGAEQTDSGDEQASSDGGDTDN